MRFAQLPDLGREKFPSEWATVTGAAFPTLRMSMAVHRQSSRFGTVGDLAIVGLTTISFAVLAVRFEFSEGFARWARPLERYQLDELPAILLVLALGMAWFAWRRAADARGELKQRLAAEERLSTMLAENRRLERASANLQEDERRKFARELHDELGQNLNAIKLDAVCIRNAGAADPAGAELACSIIDLVDRVQHTVRDMVRRLRPAGLDELGLTAALEDCIDGWRRRLPATEFELAVPRDAADWGETLNIAVYRVVQEALTNVARHAQASRVAVRLAHERGGTAGTEAIVLQVSDDGIGAGPAERPKGLGLVGMRERVESLGGSFEAATPADGGFRIVARLPVVAARA